MFRGKQADRETDRQADRQIDKETDIETDMQTGGRRQEGTIFHSLVRSTYYFNLFSSLRAQLSLASQRMKCHLFFNRWRSSTAVYANGAFSTFGQRVIRVAEHEAFLAHIYMYSK